MTIPNLIVFNHSVFNKMVKYFFFGPMKAIHTLFTWTRDFLTVVPKGKHQKFINPLYVFMPIISINPFALSMIHPLTDNKILYEHQIHLQLASYHHSIFPTTTTEPRTNSISCASCRNLPALHSVSTYDGWTITRHTRTSQGGRRNEIITGVSLPKALQDYCQNKPDAHI